VTVPGTVTHWFAAYDVRQFVPADSFTAKVRAVRDRVRANPPRAGVDRVLAPGDLENELARAHARDGIPYEQFTLDELGWVSEHTGVPLPQLVPVAS
jgi:LDH2 family malate/lactate/ureidoglycolate dehydrogenase